MDKNILLILSQNLGELYSSIESQMLAMSLAQLVKGYQKTDYLRYQKREMNSFRTRLIKQTNKYSKIVENAWNNALDTAYKTVGAKEIQTSETELSKREMTKLEQEIIERRKTRLMRNIKRTIDDSMKELVKGVESSHLKKLDNISKALVSSNDDSGVKWQKVSQLEKSAKVYDAIVEGSKEGVGTQPRVVYKDGRTVSWKSYQEMNARTTLNQETSEFQLESGKELGIVFYICNEIATCAEDHLDYQGKIYYDRDYASFGFDENTIKKIEEYISSNDLMSIDSVRDSSPFLTTRPNCRHYFQSVPLFDLIDGETNTKKLLKENGMDGGEGSEERYKALQQQRYNERNIRKWKEERDRQQTLYDNAPSALKQELLKDLNKAKGKVREWQSTQKEHINSHSYLEREYARENYKIVSEDLGYRANRKK